MRVDSRAAGAVAAKISPPHASKKINRHLLLLLFNSSCLNFFCTASEFRAAEWKILRTLHAIGGRHSLLCGVFLEFGLEFWGSSVGICRRSTLGD